MNNVKIISLITLIVGMAAAFALHRRSDVVKQTFRWTVMGTIAQVTVRGNIDEISLAETNLLPIVRNSHMRINELLSAWNPDSELSRLAAEGCTNWVARASHEVKPCYSAALKLARESDNAFNPQVGVKLRALGISDGAAYSSFDLGAIAKGFAVDVAAEKIEATASSMPSDILLDLGGNLRIIGNGIWRTGIRNPFDKSGSFAAIISLTNGESVATSGNYERFIEHNGTRLSHIIDGRTGEPTGGIAAVTVVTPRDYGAVLADGLSTTLFILGPEVGAEFLSRHYPQALALWIPDTPTTPRIIATPEMSSRLTSRIW